ncbi:mitochondrial carrier [Syncephalis pseudoplumigaleata]|uniref:Mitochondrial carrier n=1 Tax=Syncephalis pseudoplumigaleata TaxID=1712513 RepID=A0A4P9Z4P4_9FUNG|nr:mitochondrial carrier [Syncephalis pseudoplumigaleata]|eukprot:RKP27042.1 mitochondrial carrier [Syncephalis pseudoplumigaleata]
MLNTEHRRPRQQQKQLHPQPWLHFIAGGVGGTAGAVLTCPLEVVKTRMQSSLYRHASSHSRPSLLLRPFRPFLDIGHILSAFYRKEGFSALFKGLGPNLVGVIPSRAIQFAVYGNGKEMLASMNGGRESSLIHLTAAASAGICTATVTNPIWLVKTRMQLQASTANPAMRPYKNSFDCVVQVVRNEGVRGLYRGLSASYLGVTEGALQWVIYERCKRFVRERHGETTGTTAAAVAVSDHKEHWLEMLGAAAVAKLCAALITYPHEVVRTRLREVSQRRYNGLFSTFATIWREEGFTALYGGLPAHLLRVVPNAAIMFFCYEAILAAARSRSMARELRDGDTA